LNYPISPESPIEFQNSHYPDDKDAGAQIASDLFTTFHADTPDEERFFQETCVPVLKIEGKYSRLRAKAAHFPGYLPFALHLVNSANVRTNQTQ